MRSTGILYGVGTGPGDPELLTLKAIRIIREADLIAVPSADPENSLPYRTVAAVFPDIAGKQILKIPFSTEPEKEHESRQQNADTIASLLNQGLRIAFLTTGDPSIYTNYSYIADILKPQGYSCEIISGVPSFCGASSRLSQTLCCDQERLEIIPGGARFNSRNQADRIVSYPWKETTDPKSTGSFPGCGTGVTRIYMKYETSLPELIHCLVSRGEQPVIIENCCLENERIIDDPSELPEDIGYFNLVISHSDTE